MICSKFITFAVTKTTRTLAYRSKRRLWFAQNSLPLTVIRYLPEVVICSKFITFAVTKTTLISVLGLRYGLWFAQNSLPLRWQRQRYRGDLVALKRCDLLKIHCFCGDKDNHATLPARVRELWFAQNSLPLRWQRQPLETWNHKTTSCDLLKIHYLCGDKDNIILFRLRVR